MPPVAPPVAPAPVAAPLEMQAELLRLFEVVTNMCDHVIEYIEADRAERRMMIETLAQLGRVITDGAAAAVAARAAPQIVAPEPEPAPAPPPVSTSPHPFPLHERVIGGSMGAWPEKVIDLREPEAEPEPAPASRDAEIVVEVRGRFGDRWVDGFEICEVMTTPDGPRYRLRRRRDGAVLPELFDAASIRHVETFDQLISEHLDDEQARTDLARRDRAQRDHPAGKGNGITGANGNGVSDSPSHWSRS